MTDVDSLLQTYIERYRAGGSVDPGDLLEQAEGPDRAALSALIEGFLEHAAPAQEWDAAAYEGSVAQRAVEMVQDAWDEETGALPAHLVALRKEKKLSRTEIIRTLAEKLGVASKSEKVAGYYNAMEHGQLESEGISSKVLDALGGILGTTADALRRAGEQAGAPGAAPGTAFARTHRLEVSTDSAASPGRPEAGELSEADWDEVDRLFRGGDVSGGRGD